MSVKSPPFQVSGWGNFPYGLLEHPVVEDAIKKQHPWEKLAVIARQAGVDPEKTWRAVKFRRLAVRQLLPVIAIDGQPFSWSRLPLLDRVAHEVDLAVGGGGAQVFQSDAGLFNDPEAKVHLKIRSMMDEAMESSIMEGAAVTRDQAREVLRTGRTPTDQHRRMVVNNYRAMLRVRELRSEPLTVPMILDLHALLTEGTWKPGEEHKQGRFRRADEPVRVEDQRDGTVVFVPPAAEDLPARLRTLCTFANEGGDGPVFIHPLTRACLLHLFLGYEHPFCDGNGRTARALFYWHAFRSGYDIFEFLPISEIIRKAWSRYAHAYQHVQVDGNDTTYFLAFHFDVIRQALDRLRSHIERESARLTRSLSLVAKSPGLNLRQRLLLEHALRHIDTAYTVQAHKVSYDLSTNTARSDLDGLVRARYFVASKQGRQSTYHLSPMGLRRLRKASERA